MFVMLEARTPCLLCGYQHTIYRFADVRVNKRSLRGQGTELVSLGARCCPECGERNAGDLLPVSAYRMHPEDAAKVAAYRARRWPLTAVTVAT